MGDKEHNGMEKGQKEARIGLDSEKDIINAINNNKAFRHLLEKCLENLGIGTSVISARHTARPNKVKTDIAIMTDQAEIGASVKSMTVTSFHHLDRRWLEEWHRVLDMPPTIVNAFGQGISRVAADSAAEFISRNDRNGVKDFLARNLKTIIEQVFVMGEKELKVLMINDIPSKVIYIYKMNDVLDLVYRNASGNISFSPKGIIRLGDFVSIQRKGGDHSGLTIPKTNPKHPGNQIQFKFYPREFAHYVETGKQIEFAKITYQDH